MIPLEGRAIGGLDEFMLRLGHLTALSRIATTDGGSANRFERALASKFTETTPVPKNLVPAFARYLRIKGLSPTEPKKPDKKKEIEYRYPDLSVVDPAGPGETVVSNNNEVSGQWQDVNLCNPMAPSKVGAISFGGKKGSKTGLSHVIDWGGFLGLFNASGALTNFGQLLGKYAVLAGRAEDNPYVLGAERLILGYLIIREDFDVFATLVERLPTEPRILRKSDAMRLYLEVVTLLSDRAERASGVSQGRRQQLFSLWREVKPKRSGDDQISSTAWHRIASRLENFVDLGLLRKDASEQYEYKYRLTDRLDSAKRTLEGSKSAEEWIDRHLVDTLTGASASDEGVETAELESFLVTLLSALSRPMSPLPLDVMAVGVAALSLEGRTPITLGTARRSLEAYAIRFPERARLSAGVTRRAEYISVDAAVARGRR